MMTAVVAQAEGEAVPLARRDAPALWVGASLTECPGVVCQHLGRQVVEEKVQASPCVTWPGKCLSLHFVTLRSMLLIRRKWRLLR